MAGVLWTFCSLCPHSMASLQLAWQTRLQVLGLSEAACSPAPHLVHPTHPCPDSTITPSWQIPLPSTCSSVCTVGWAWRFYEVSGGLPSSGEPGRWPLHAHTHPPTHTHRYTHTQIHKAVKHEFKIITTMVLLPIIFYIFNSANSKPALGWILNRTWFLHMQVSST